MLGLWLALVLLPLCLYQIIQVTRRGKAKIEYFALGNRRLKIDISRQEADCERVLCYDLLTYLPTQTPVVLSGPA